MRLLVCGGRSFGNWKLAKAALDKLHAAFDITVVIHGACHLGGADSLADEWANDNKILREPYPVNHALDGPWPACGPRRNQRMLETSRPDMVLALPGQRGTEDMVRRAHAAGLTVWTVKSLGL